MRLILPAFFAVAMILPTDGLSQDEKKPMLPDVKAKEWKKLGDAGLEAWDVKEGKGDAVKTGANLKVLYTGWLTNGEIFDSSGDRTKPAEFGLDSLIPGWKDGVPGMKVGGVRRLKIPPELAYGKRERGKIPANSTLVFEIEVLEMENKPMLPDLQAKEWKKLGDAGLEIWDVKEGEGDAVKDGAKVTVHYTGWLTSGKVFDSSVGGEPITFGLKEVIKGWTQGIPGMKPGGMRRLKIPSELGYGARGAGADIPPNSVLIFEVKLVK